ncbi:hypothetical protein C1752_16681 [Acaryochloris thomasi RCC1774]|uniref:Uncharacterized protein n=1 Tax=Acaryochloris thomasi RCC1774 TaxID=1764569 RepID=A0A2W1JMT8_9CYAN|nr:hypothetical protein [Acaryochloris thomasi]PZD70217.1 hypothetical protein C1752_16681 [Acaryochloris thomasi RCC1774]
MLHILDLATNTLLLGFALATLQAAIALTANALRRKITADSSSAISSEAANDKLVEAKPTPAQKARPESPTHTLITQAKQPPTEKRQGVSRPVVTAAQAADFAKNNPLAPEPIVRETAAPRTKPVAQAIAKPKAAAPRSLAELLVSEHNKKA